ncbi:uncharacterized protein VTP21DRAFT_6599 [Calcarisporiella thermophila]|uniref:uncharacterized protein n=1 Tax=Calcarisporiella thermophila TaxID=911321 RepID=UPI003742A4E3
MIDLKGLLFPSQRRAPNQEEARLALIYWTRAANQGMDFDARVKMGDYYYKGIGTPKDPERAAACYQVAAHNQHAMAIWNLGWMHENGIGVEKDFNLAKRNYDTALEAHREAYFPVKLSLLRLKLHYLWTKFRGDNSGGELDLGISSWFYPPLLSWYFNRPAEQQQQGSAEQANALGRELSHDSEEGSGWLDSHRLPHRVDSGSHRQSSEDEEGGDGYMEGDEESMENFIENVVVLAVCLAIGWAVYFYHFRRLEQTRRDERENDRQRQQQPQQQPQQRQHMRAGPPS